MSSAASNPEVEPSNNEEEKNTSVSTEPEPSINDGKPKEFVKTLDVPKWLSDEDVIEHLNNSIEEQRLEEEYKCTIELRELGTDNANADNGAHLSIAMKGSDTRELGRVRRSLEDMLIAHLNNATPAVPKKNNRETPPLSLGRLLYALALSSADNSPRWNDRSEHRTVMGRALLPLYSKHKVWMNIVELPKDDDGNYHGMFLAGEGGRLFKFYWERYACRVDIYGDFGKHEKTGVEKHEHASPMLCEPYVLVTSREGKANVDKCLQFIEHRIKDHAEKFGVSRGKEVESLGEQRRMRRQSPKARGKQRGRRGDTEKEEDKKEE